MSEEKEFTAEEIVDEVKEAAEEAAAEEAEAAVVSQDEKPEEKQAEEQAKRLRSGGVQGVQGFRYHKPMPAEDFAALLERKA